MIRLTFVLRRKPGMSLAEFQQYWASTHGPLVARHSTTLKILRYVQVHTLEDPVNDQLAAARGGMEKPYDGVAELWWTNRDALAASFGSVAGKAAGKELLEDEARFIDLPNSPLWLAYEYPQVNPMPEEMVAREHSSLVKLFFCLRQPSDRNMEEAQLYWRTNHGPTIRGVASGMRLRRYLQIHRCEDALEGQLRMARGTMVPPYAGHAEAWFDRADLAAIASTPEGQRAMAIAVEDESKFIDFSRSAMWIAKERVFIDRR
jgi:EthD domain